uniref:Beta-catenin-interacting ICAT domain-containing protein n=1 Tax=Palpitomonas bilix TaxID=652834 RepID=A0A7S3G4K7_9EUKA|mmetsp:Transcript_21311/g.55399  ORF Transcript_21311/g.55399 Transcript_21311/m.55399 type:complete len:193 (+) Transcript_21311:139-717(+)
MASRGDSENAALKKQIEEQLNRLLTQLEDLEEMKEDLDDDEYESTREETLEQLKEFNASLERHKAGNMTLVNDLDAVQLAIQGAISNAFKTPEVIKMFANKQPAQLRFKLGELQREFKLQKVPQEVYDMQAVEILAALKKLGEKLSPQEDAFLQEKRTKQVAQFEQASEGVGEGQKAEILSTAASTVESAKK